MYKCQIGVNWIKVVTLLCISTLRYIANGPIGEKCGNKAGEREREGKVDADMRRAGHQEPK